MNDRELDRLFLRWRDKKDLAALGRVFDLVARELLGIAAHLVRDPGAAEDVVQATFVTAIEHAERYDASRNLVPWLVGILARTARDWNRRDARRIEPDRLVGREAGEPSTHVEERELSEQLAGALAKVPEPYHSVLVRALQMGLSPSEIATELDRAPGTVRVQIHRGLELLRKELPLGLATGALAAALPTRGLAAVREAVVAHAAAVTPAAVVGSAVVIVLGGIAMKKVVVASLALACAAIAWLAVSRSDTLEPGAHPHALVGAHRPDLAKEAREFEPVPAEHASDRAAVVAIDETAPAVSSPAPGSLRLRVRWHDGASAAGVRADVRPYDDLEPTAVRIELVTDERGEALVPELAAGSYRIGFDRTGEKQAEVHAGLETLVEVGLLRGIDVEGRVVDERGEPIAGADVLLSDPQSAIRARCVAQSDESGRFRIRSVSGESQIGARARRHAPSDWVMVKDPVFLAGETSTLALELARGGGSIDGTVRDESGRAISNALVRVGGFQGDARSDLSYWMMPTGMGPDMSVRLPVRPLETRTDADGRFAADAIENGALAVSVDARGFAAWTGTVDAREGEQATLDVVLVRGGSVRGTVRHEDGRPAAGVAIVARASLPIANRSTTTAQDGSYRIADVAPGGIELHANHHRRAGALAVVVNVAVDPGGETTWDVTLPAALAFVGRALDEAGAALAGWHVRASAGLGKQVDVRTDAAGAFTMAGCEDVPYELELRAPEEDWAGISSARAKEVRPGRGEVVLRVTESTRPSAWIVGRLVRTDGTPLGGSTVYADHQALGRGRKTTPDADGAFRLGPFPPGTVELRLASSEHPYTQLCERDLGARETVDVGTLVVEAPGRLRIVAHTDGRRASERLVAELDRIGGNKVRRPLVGVDGVLASGPLPTGEYEVFLSAKGCAAVRRTITVPAGTEETLDVELAPGTDCPIRIRRRDGRTVGYLTFIVRSEDGDRVAVSGLLQETTAERTVSVGLAPGRYTIVANGEEGSRAEATFVVGPLHAPPPSVELVLE